MSKITPNEETTNNSYEEHYPTQEEIRVRAYEIYLSRAPEEGNEIEDWLQAEREIWEKR